MPEKDLAKLLSSLKPILDPTPYLFLFFSKQDFQPTPQDMNSSIMLFQETEGWTVLCTPEAHASILSRHNLHNDTNQKQQQQDRYARITLSVYSDLQAVGLTYAVSEALTKRNIPANVVAAYHHDHVFVPYEKKEEAMETLKQLSSESSTADT